MIAAINGHTDLCRLFIDTYDIDAALKTEHGGLAHQFAEVNIRLETTKSLTFYRVLDTKKQHHLSKQDMIK